MTEPALCAVAELVGRILVREVDRATVEALRAPELADALASFGVELPPPGQESDWIEARGAEYHDLFLRPDTGPLVQSLWTQGRYEGDAAVRVRQLAEHAGVTFQAEAARGAAVDHLGSLLLLWSACVERAPEVAQEITASHLDWALAPLAKTERAGGFYGAIARATRSLIGALRPEREATLEPGD